MTKLILAAAFLCGLGVSTLPAIAQKADVAGAADHAAVGRYEGSAITFYETKAYDEVSLPSKAMERADGNDSSAWQTEFSGKLTSIGYAGPGERSILEVMRNYEQALTTAGFEIRFFCRGQKECTPGRGIPGFFQAGRGSVRLPSQWDTTIYMLAERNDAKGPVTVAMLGVETKARAGQPVTPHVAVTIVEGQPMEADKISVVEASQIEQALERDGRIAIYGIYFDFDKADIQPDSQPQIEQLGALLKQNPKLEVLIVGHTDGQGAFDYNLSLSQKRAKAVADRLVAEHGIPAGRLTAAGAGMTAPVATNRTEDGRSKNRRVELVEIYRGS